MAAVDAWKQKYLDSLTQLESKEREWRSTEELLRQCVARLALAADGVDASLDRQLGALRSAIRQGTNSVALREFIEPLSEAILRLDAQRRSPAKALSLEETLAALLDAIRFPGGTGRKALELRRRIGQVPATDVTRELIDLVNEAFVGLASGGGDKAGLLGRFLRSGGDAAPVPPPADEDPLPWARTLLLRAVADALGAVDGGDTLIGVLRDTGDRDGLEAAADRIRTALAAAPQAAATVHPGGLPNNEVLLQLLERLDIPDDLSARAARIRSGLDRELDPLHLDYTLRDIADLIAEMRSRVQREKVELEEFLEQLTERLRELDQNLQANLANQRESFAGGRQLDVAVSEQVQGIERSVRDAADLPGLREVIARRIDTIRDHMTRFRAAEDRRIAEADEQVRVLTARLQTVEAEVGELRERVQAERSQALIDPLTGIANRLAYNERIALEYARWRRTKQPLCLAVWDVDRFKNINDAYGHQAGDKVLRVVARLLEANTRATDLVARYGGEEFVMLLPDTELAGALMVADKLRKAIEQCEFHHRGTRVAITISGGVAQFRGDDEADAVFQRADEALYAAKAAGRNRCLGEGGGP